MLTKRRHHIMKALHYEGITFLRPPYYMKIKLHDLRYWILWCGLIQYWISYDTKLYDGIFYQYSSINNDIASYDTIQNKMCNEISYDIVSYDITLYQGMILNHTIWSILKHFIIHYYVILQYINIIC